MPEFRRCCPTCGLEVQATVSTCPRDGTTIDNPFQTDPTFQQKYEFLESIGAGGMGVIYKARHLILNKIIAIKMVHSHLATEQAIRRFQVEGKAAASLHHPYIIGVQDLGTTTSGQPYMVLDFLNGKTLSQVLASEGHLDHKRFLRLFLQVTDALVHAHTRGVLHRDIKPANIMIVKGLNGEEEVRILDFGLAKIVDEAEAARHLTKTGVAMGSPLYMSPEQAQGAKVDERSDIYSLGCTMFEALTGTPPFEGNTPFETMLKHLNDVPPTLTSASLGQEFDPRLQYVMDRMLEKSLKCRYQSMQEVRDDLLKIQRNEPLIAASPPPPPKSKKPLIIGIACASAIAAGLLFFFLSPGLLHHDSKSNAAAATVAPAAPPAATPGTETRSVEPKVNPEANLSPSVDALLNKTAKEVIANKVRENYGSVVLDLSGLRTVLPKDSDFESVSKAINARILSLKGLPITDKGLRYILPLKLTSLNLDSTDIEDLPGLENMSDLAHLHLSKTTKLSPKGIAVIARLTNLEELDLSESSVSDDELPSLYKLHKLKSLNLSACRGISSEAVERIRNILKGCTVNNQRIVQGQDEPHVRLQQGIQQSQHGQWLDAYVNFSKVISMLKDAPESPLRIECQGRAGDCKFAMKDYSLASHFYGEAIQATERTKDESLDLFRLYTKQADALERLSKQPHADGWQSLLQDALVARLKADQLFSHNQKYASINDRQMKTTNLLNASYDCAQLHKPEDAARWFAKANANQIDSDSEGSAETALSISICYIQRNDFANALPYLQRSLKYFSSHASGNMEKKNLLEHGLADCYYRLGRYKESEALLKAALARPIADASLTKRNYESLIEVLQKENKADEVARYKQRLGTIRIDPESH